MKKADQQFFSNEPNPSSLPPPPAPTGEFIQFSPYNKQNFNGKSSTLTTFLSLNHSFVFPGKYF